MMRVCRAWFNIINPCQRSAFILFCLAALLSFCSHALPESLVTCLRGAAPNHVKRDQSLKPKRLRQLFVELASFRYLTGESVPESQESLHGLERTCSATLRGRVMLKGGRWTRPDPLKAPKSLRLRRGTPFREPSVMAWLVRVQSLLGH